MAKPPKLLVTRGETFALECAIRHYRNSDSFLRKIGLIQPGDDEVIQKAGDQLLVDLRSLRRRITDGRPRQTYK